MYKMGMGKVRISSPCENLGYPCLARKSRHKFSHAQYTKDKVNALYVRFMNFTVSHPGTHGRFFSFQNEATCLIFVFVSVLQTPLEMRSTLERKNLSPPEQYLSFFYSFEKGCKTVLTDLPPLQICPFPLQLGRSGKRYALWQNYWLLKKHMWRHHVVPLSIINQIWS